MRVRAQVGAGTLVVAAVTLLAPAPLRSQQPADIGAEIQQSQRRLEQIRAERALLEREIGDVRNRVRDASQELANVERRLSATLAVLEEVEFQSDATSEQVLDTQRDLVLSQDRLSESRAVLSRRLRDIYKMGPLHTVRVLLAARSFSDLLNRYRYLQQIAASDRQLVERVTDLEARLVAQNEELRQRMAMLGSLRQERVSEVAQLRSVEEEHAAAIRDFRTREARADSRLDQLDADQERLASVIEQLEARRRELEAARARAGTPTLEADAAGTLDWPVEGDIIYSFGREQQPNGRILRWNGIGIAAPTGTPVRAVAPGQVALAGPFEGYGLTVILDHGNGTYTLYTYLEELGVVAGRSVGAQQVVGTVGGADSPEGPHLEFQIRAASGGSSPVAQDPLRWLKPRT